MTDREIDTADSPPIADWSKAVVGKFYRPIKKPLTIRLDADVLAWLKAQGKGYQTRINALLRSSMEKSRRQQAEQQELVLSPKQWRAFVKALDLPARVAPGLARLFRETNALTRRAGSRH